MARSARDGGDMGSGNLCIVDADNQRVRDVNTRGTMSTVAGTLYATWQMPAPPVCATLAGASVVRSLPWMLRTAA
jgi:hypothetical protein